MIIVIVGPTGVGKTKLSVALARHFKTEIISGDSVQVYKDLNIGSAKVTTEEQSGILHHLIDILEPNEDFSVALYQKLVRSKIEEFKQRNIVPIIVGGTGLYIKSVFYDYDFTNSKRDKDLEKSFELLSNEEVYELLKEEDLEAYNTLHKNNRKRIIQAISRSRQGGSLQEFGKDHLLYDDVLFIGLHLDRDILYPLIDHRVDRMFQDGLLEEVKHLYQKNIQSNSVSAIGYKELYAYFNHELTLEEAKNLIKQHSRNLAKKQYTFFNNQLDVKWFHVKIDDFEQTIEEVLNYIGSK